MGFWTRLTNSTLRRDSDMDSLDEEMQFHLEQKTEELIAIGIPAREARRRARLHFGNPAKLRDEVREVESLRWLTSSFRDLRFAARNLRRRPVFTATAVVSIALSLAAVTALFSYVDALFLRPLPVHEPARIVSLDEFAHGKPGGGNPHRMDDYATQVSAFESVGGYYTDGAILSGLGDPERIVLARTYGALLSTLGQKPLLGRPFTKPEEDGLGAPVALISHGLWQSHFSASPSVVGQVLHLDGAAVTIIGVLPQGQSFPQGVDVTAPAGPTLRAIARGAGFLGVVARLKPNVTLEQAQTELNVVTARLAQQYPATDAGRTTQAVGLQQQLTRDFRQPVFLLFDAALMILLMACVNVGSLLLARGAERTRESAVRIALGAGRATLMRLYLMESFLLALLGGLFGLLLGAAAFQGLEHLMPPSVDLPVTPRFDLRVLAAGAAASLLSGLLFGLAPAWMAYATRNIRTLSGTQVTASRSNLRWRQALVVLQVAMGTVLLAGVGLTARSFANTRAASMGFSPAQVFTLQVKYPWDTPSTKLNATTQRMLEAIQSTPGVISAGVIDRVPLTGNSQSLPIRVEGAPANPELATQPVDVRAFLGDSFQTLGIPLLEGRLPHTHAANASPETVINKTLARLYFPDGNAIGHTITWAKTKPGASLDNFYRIVGVVADTRVDATQTTQPAEFFLLAPDTFWPFLNFVVKSNQTDPAWLQTLHQAVARVDPGQVVGPVQPVEAAVAGAWIGQKVRLILLAAFSSVALLLACVGVYGVLTSDVLQRTHEIGIRLALGADRSRILRAVLFQGLRLSALGLIVGAMAAALAGRALQTLLYEVRVNDPFTWLAATAMLLAVTLACSYLPARTATRIDPARALYSE
jgi:putative ABC transport system permease protein